MTHRYDEQVSVMITLRHSKHTPFHGTNAQTFSSYFSNFNCLVCHLARSTTIPFHIPLARLITADPAIEVMKRDICVLLASMRHLFRIAADCQLTQMDRPFACRRDVADQQRASLNWHLPNWKPCSDFGR